MQRLLGALTPQIQVESPLTLEHPHLYTRVWEGASEADRERLVAQLEEGRPSDDERWAHERQRCEGRHPSPLWGQLGAGQPTLPTSPDSKLALVCRFDRLFRFQRCDRQVLDGRTPIPSSALPPEVRAGSQFYHSLRSQDLSLSLEEELQWMRIYGLELPTHLYGDCPVSRTRFLPDLPGLTYGRPPPAPEGPDPEPLREYLSRYGRLPEEIDPRLGWLELDGVRHPMPEALAILQQAQS